MTRTLHLVVPGLLGPWPRHGDAALPALNAPALMRLLSRAVPAPFAAPGIEATLFQLFDLPLPADRDLPVAAVTRLAEPAQAGAAADDPGWWLRADPVHLHADLHQILLFDARGLNVTPEEAAALAAEFNAAFAGDGLELRTPHPSRWYLRLEGDPGFTTRPLADAIGKDIDPLLPLGEDSRRWHTLLTEIQMLFHASEVNQARETRQQPAINSVWLWGGGPLPGPARSPAAGVYTGNALGRGLARYAGAAVSAPPTGAGDWIEAAAEDSSSLVVLEETRYDPLDDDPERWSAHVSALEQAWFEPCLQLLRQRQLAEFAFYPCDGRRFSVAAARLRRFWRRDRQLADFIQ